MNDRQRFALLHPLESGEDDVAPYRTIRRHKAGFLLVSVLAVDR